MSPPRWSRKKSLDRTLAGKDTREWGSLINAREMKIGANMYQRFKCKYC